MLGGAQTKRGGLQFASIKIFYATEAVEDRLNFLRLTMLKNKAGAPELTASAAELRALIPFFKMLVEQWDAPACGEEELLAREAMLGLHACYECLLSEKEDDVSQGVLEGHAFDFHRCLVRLNALNAERWVLRPKLHGFLELALERSLPSKTWVYRDESFGGDVARMAHRRGGKPTARGMSTAALLKFCSREDLPRILEPQ